MAATQAQRATLFNTLTELMGQQDAETLINGLPPSGWDNMATSDDLNATSQVLQARFAAAIAESNAAVITAITAGFAHAAQERAEIKTATATGFAHAAQERAEIKTATATGFAHAAQERAEIKTTTATGFAHAAQERAEVLKRQAWHAYAMISTIVLASISIWIALLYGPGAG